MRITTSDYLELPLPAEAACAALRNPALWQQLPLELEQVGEMWRWRHDLYTLQMSTTPHHTGSGTVLRWEARPVAGGPLLQLEITLHPATLVTHAVLRASLVGAGGWPWQRLWWEWQLRHLVRLGAAALVARLREHHLAQAPAQGSLSHAAPDNDTQPPGGAALADMLRPFYPQTVAHFEAMGALDHLERVWRLERGWDHILRGDYDTTLHLVQPPSANPPPLDYDLIYAGGGLGLMHAAVMAQCYGWRVLLFDRGEVGAVHREWNISKQELEALVRLGLLTWDDLAPVIMREYRDGVVRFAAGPATAVPESELWMPTVLNVALDAGALLRLLRQKFLAAGGTICDYRAFRRVSVQPPHQGHPLRVAVELETLDTPERQRECYTARLLLDGMGSVSPLALLRHAGKPFAGVCPTVGTVASGFVPGSGRNEFDPTLGDILISVADTQGNRQMIWEGFPGRGDDLTVYLFYYAALTEAGRRTPKQPDLHPLTPPPLDAPVYSLLELFEAYFALLPDYKQPGPDFRHIKPVYGYIPGRHTLHPQEAPLLPGVLPVGDSAAQQSPLTFCGFGSHVRNLERTTSLLDYALHHNLTGPRHLRHISAFQTNVSLNWVFSRFMQPWGTPNTVNELQNAFLGAMNDLGEDLASRFFQDRTRWHDYNQVVWSTMLRYPKVFLIAWPVLGVAGVAQWMRDYLRFSATAALATALDQAERLGADVEQAAVQACDMLAPAFGLRLRGMSAEWRAMGWRDAAGKADNAADSTAQAPGDWYNRGGTLSTSAALPGKTRKTDSREEQTR